MFYLIKVDKGTEPTVKCGDIIDGEACCYPIADTLHNRKIYGEKYSNYVNPGDKKKLIKEKKKGKTPTKKELKELYSALEEGEKESDYIVVYRPTDS